MNANQFLQRLKKLRSPAVAKSHSHLAADAGDVAMGVRMGQVFALAKEFMDMPRKVLSKLARSKKMPERRTSIVSTLFFIGKGDVDDAFKLAEMLIHDKKDLIHKAVGWVLRFAGDKDRKQLLKFLDTHAGTMPRVTLRYATEHFDRKQGEDYLNLKNK